MKNFNLLKIYKAYIIIMASGVIILSVLSFLRFPHEACAQASCYEPRIPDGTIIHLRLENIGNDAEVDLTPYLAAPKQKLRDMHLWDDSDTDAKAWTCVSAGWATNYDYEQDDTQKNHKWTTVENDKWWLKVQFPSERSGCCGAECPNRCSHENPDVDVICFHKSVAQGPGMNDKKLP